MRVVMFGYQTWGHRTLQALLDSEHEVVLVGDPPQERARLREDLERLGRRAGRGARRPGAASATGPTTRSCSTRLKEADPDIIVANNWRTWIPPRDLRPAPATAP